MTSAQPMPPKTGGRSLAAMCWATLVCGLALSGCSAHLKPPTELTAPYPQPKLWAVVPFANESGVSIVDPYFTADVFTQQLQQVKGIDTVPVNRVIVAMRRLNMPEATTPADVRQLANALGVDGVIIGTVTAYDPYPPLMLGAAIQLFQTSPHNRLRGFDPQELTRSPRGTVSPGDLGSAGPVAQAAGVFDATNHQTLSWLKNYAAGRSEPHGAYGQDIYLVSMELYTQFVSYRLIHDLLAFEQARLTPMTEIVSGH